MTLHNREYYASRAAIERAKAEASSDPSVAAVHRELAEMYERKLERKDSRTALHIAMD